MLWNEVFKSRILTVFFYIFIFHISWKDLIDLQFLDKENFFKYILDLLLFAN